ncbi:MAG: hypothetical protein QXW80_00470, partial [Candidatus Micrarchaeia archaeon]
KVTGTFNAYGYRCRADQFYNLFDCVWSGSGTSCNVKCREVTQEDLLSLLTTGKESVSGSLTGKIENNQLIGSITIGGLGTMNIVGDIVEDSASGKLSFSSTFKSDFTCEPNVYVDGTMIGTGIRRERVVKTNVQEENMIIAGVFNTPDACRNFPIRYTLTLNKKGDNLTGNFYGEVWKCSISGDFCSKVKCRYVSSRHCEPDPIMDSESVRDSIIKKSVEIISGSVSGNIQGNNVNLVIHTQFGDLFASGSVSSDQNGKLTFAGNIDSGVTCEPGVYVRGPIIGEGLKNEVGLRKAKLGENCSSSVKCEEGVCANGVCVREPTCSGNLISCGASCCLSSQTCDATKGSCIPQYCKSPLTQCGMTCVDTRSNILNCGSCGTTCPIGTTCVNSACVDINLLILPDRTNCGGVACTDDEICLDDRCIKCGVNQTRCENSCVDLNTSNSNCGSCGNVCKSDEYCLNGICKPSSSCVLNSIQYIRCGNECCDLTQWCDPITMKCTPKLPLYENITQCGPFLTDLSSDQNNCGTCFNSCKAGESCINGRCSVLETCGNGRCGENETCSNCPQDCGSCIETGCSGEYPTLCGDKCVNTLNDTANCGSCNNKCQADQICSGGNCIGVLNSNCTSDNDCAYGSCIDSTCQLSNCITDSDCRSNEYCNTNLGICDGGCTTSPDNCNEITGLPSSCDPATRNCITFSCPAGTVLFNNTCLQITLDSCNKSEECKSNICYNGNCLSTDNPIQPTQTVVNVGKPAFGSSAGGKASPQLLSVQENPAASDIFYSLFQTSKTRLLAYDSCLRGSICSSSADCCGAPCLNSRCACSNSACTTTADCCSGYCENGKCSSAPTQKLSLFSALTSPNLGCAGLIEECSPDEKTCISLCNGMSLLLVLVAGSFGAFTWTRFKHPVAGLVAAFTPILIGVALYPFLGIISGILLFSLLIYKDTGSIEV